MTIHEAIRARRTLRDFENRPVDRATLERIVEAGLQAPSNDHLRSWEFIIVDTPAERLRLLAEIRQEFPAADVAAWLDGWRSTDSLQRAMYLDGVPKQHRMLLTAGTLLLPCFRQPHPLLQPASQSDLNGFASIWCCIENMLLAAAAEGIGGVTRIPFPRESIHLKRVLSIPADYEVACYLALGYPAPEASHPRQHAPAAAERIRIGHW